MTKKTKIPKARSFRDKYELASITAAEPAIYDLDEVGDGDVELGYKRLKTRCHLHGKKHGKTFAIRKKGDEALVYLVK